MTSPQIREWIDNPQLLNDETLLQLEFLVQRFPLFQVFHYLYLKNLKKLGDEQYERKLRSSALYVADREALFNYLEIEEVSPAVVPKPEGKVNQMQSIDSFLESVKDRRESHPVTDLAKKALATQDYASYFLVGQPDQPPLVSSDEPQLKHQDLVDRYISQTGNERTFKPLPATMQPAVDELQDDSAEAAEGKQSTFFTESLAKIYIKQRKYDKALHIIKGLSLKYPEKSVYFADQIRFLELLVNNIKQ